MLEQERRREKQRGFRGELDLQMKWKREREQDEDIKRAK